jgi:alpha-1,3-rhamnosyl/mannosyltransferase
MGARAYVTPYLKFRPFPPCPVVAIICDPTDLLPDAGARSAWPRLAARTARRVLARHAAACVTISAWSRRELSRILSLSPEIFRVIPPGVSLPHPPPAGAQPRYILHLSNGKPHKNLGRLLDAFAAIPQTLQAAHPLRLAGIHDDRHAILQEAVLARGLQGLVFIEGHVDEEALPALYGGAAAFAFPSLTEGFGIPPLEAMLCGVPVVASTGGALPDTLGDAACLVDPCDTRRLRDALVAVLTDRALRQTLANRGRARAASFPPSRTGALLAAVVDEVVGLASQRV